MKKKYYLLPLLLFAPLLMGNSPAPYPTEDEYFGINVNCLSINEIEGQYEHVLEIENTGGNYLLFNRHLNLNGSYYYGRFTGFLFESEVLSPGTKRTYTFTSDRKIALDSGENIWSGETYTIKEEGVTFTDSTITKIGDKLYQLDSTIEGLGDYYYSAIVEVNYDGVDYAFDVPINRNNKRIYTNEELDLSKINIKKITAYRSSYNTYKGGYQAAWYIVLIPVLVVIGIIAGFILLVSLIVGLVYLIMALYRRKKNKAISK